MIAGTPFPAIIVARGNVDETGKVDHGDEGAQTPLSTPEADENVRMNHPRNRFPE